MNPQDNTDTLAVRRQAQMHLSRSHSGESSPLGIETTSVVSGSKPHYSDVSGDRRHGHSSDWTMRTASADSQYAPGSLPRPVHIPARILILEESKDSCGTPVRGTSYSSPILLFARDEENSEESKTTSTTAHDSAFGRAIPDSLLGDDMVGPQQEYLMEDTDEEGAGARGLTCIQEGFLAGAAAST